MKNTTATMIVRKRSQIDEQQRLISTMENMIAGWVQQNAHLEQEIANEERKTKTTDPDNYRYSLYAKQQRSRRDKNNQSIAALQQPLENARATFATYKDEMLVLEGKPVTRPAIEVVEA